MNPLLPKQADEILAKNGPDTGGVAIDTISALSVEPVVGGVLIRADGVAVRQGAYAARLIPVSSDTPPQDGILRYTFKVYYPRANTGVGPASTRTLSVAEFASAQDLDGIRTIRVSGAANAREVRRR